MTVSLSTPVTGAAQTGLTSPTYTLVTDVSPLPQGKQWVVSALGGTQAGVTTHSVSSPFTLNVTRPTQLRTLGAPNPITGVISNVPMNKYTLLVRKGVTILSGQAIQIGTIRVEISAPAGSDTADTPNLRAMCSAAIGALDQVSSGFGDTLVSGVL